MFLLCMDQMTQNSRVIKRMGIQEPWCQMVDFQLSQYTYEILKSPDIFMQAACNKCFSEHSKSPLTCRRDRHFSIRVGTLSDH